MSVTIVDASTRFAAGGIRVLASGEVELVYTAPTWQVIEASADLRSWTRVREDRYWGDDYRFRVRVPGQPSGPTRFFHILSPAATLAVHVPTVLIPLTRTWRPEGDGVKHEEVSVQDSA